MKLLYRALKPFTWPAFLTYSVCSAPYVSKAMAVAVVWLAWLFGTIAREDG